MNMLKGIFKDGKTKEQNELQKEIESQALEIIKKTLIRKLKIVDINKLEKLYNKYYKKYPDIQSEAKANKRIIQLRTML